MIENTISMHTIHIIRNKEEQDSCDSMCYFPRTIFHPLSLKKDLTTISHNLVIFKKFRRIGYTG